VLAFAVRPGTRGTPPASLLEAQAARPEPVRRTRTYRNDALRRAAVWDARHDRSATALVTTPDPTNTFAASPLECRYQPERAQGTTSKFNCLLIDGEVVKVKYGGTAEIQAEVAASRLLTRLGFAADRMFVVPRVRCYGCPRLPFEISWVTDLIGMRDTLMKRFSSHRYVDFTWTSVERRFPGAAIEVDGVEGWSWFELDEVDTSSGASNAERDALRVTAMLLAHWDNKSANQRLVCLERDGSSQRCARPFAMIHDLGATFGPNKVNLAAWAAAPIWSDVSRCTVTMRQFPYQGGTFTDKQISEAGRRLLVRELDTISETETREWFESARFREAGAWTAAFREKARQIRAAGPCPTP
jgi:hypothetical protein